MKILILLAILYLVNARHSRNRRFNDHYDRDNINRKEMSKIIDILQDISNNIKRPPPQIVYVPYPIVLNGKDTPDLAVSSMKEDTAHNDGTPKTEGLYNRNNPGPINILSRFSVDDSTMTWGLIEKEKEDTPQEQITETNSNNFLFDSDQNGDIIWEWLLHEKDSASQASEETVASKTPQEQKIEAYSKNDNFLIDSDKNGDKNWGKYSNEEDSASPAPEETEISDSDGGRQLNLDPFKTLELQPTAPPVELESNQAGLDLNSEEAWPKVETEGIKEMVTTKEVSNECTLAILACCKQKESDMETCFEIFKCSKIYAPGITCLKDVTSVAFKKFQTVYGAKIESNTNEYSPILKYKNA